MVMPLLSVDSTKTGKAQGYLKSPRSTSATPISTSAAAHHRSSNIKSLKEIQALTDLSTIDEQLAAVCEQELVLDRELDREFRDSSEVQKQLASLCDYAEILRSQVPGALGLCAMVEKTAGLATQITKQARLVDVEQRNVKVTLELVEAIKQVNEAAALANLHMSSMAYEKAAEQVGLYLRFSPENLKAIKELAEVAGSRRLSNPDSATNLAGANKSDAASLSTSLPQLEAVRKRLLAEFSKDFSLALKDKNEARLVEIFKLFPKIGFREEGLAKYGGHIGEMVAEQVRTAMRQPTAQNPLYFADLLLGLFESVAQMIDQQLPLLETVYGPGQMLYLLRSFQVAVDDQSAVIFDTFVDKRELPTNARVASDTLKRDFAFRRGNSQSAIVGADKRGEAGASSLDLGDVDMLLNEWGLMSQRSRFYMRFMNYRGLDEVEKLNVDEATTSAESVYGTDGLLKSTRLEDKLAETLAYYLVLENYYVRISLERAISVETLTESTLTTTSMEDAFFIFSKALTRACGSRSCSAVVAVSKSIAKLLDSEFLEYLQQHLVSIFSYKSSQHWFGKQFSQSSLAKLEAAVYLKGLQELYASDSITQGQVLLNNLATASNYIEKLVHQIESLAGEVFESESDVKAINQALLGFGKPMEKAKSLLRVWLDTFSSQVMRPAVKFIVSDGLSSVKYNVASPEDVVTINSTPQMADHISRFVDTVTNAFNKENLAAIQLRLADLVSKEYESQVFSGNSRFRFTRYGGQGLRNDLASLEGELLAQLSLETVSETFSRLQRVALLLSLDHPEDIARNLETLKFSSQELLRIARLRVDWKVDDVQSALTSP